MSEDEPRRTASDGGIVETGPDTPFGETETTPMSRQQRARLQFREWVAAPAKILWEDWRARVGGLIILLYRLMGTVGVIALEPPTGNAPAQLRPFQNMAHPLGTDGTGVDLLKYTVHATPPMLEMIAAGAVFATGLGTGVGVFSGYVGGRADRALMTLTDIMMTIPGLPLVIVVAVILEPTNPWFIGVVLTINNWSGLARTVRSQVLTIKRESFVEASRLMGLSKRNILTKDVTPNVMPYVLVNFVNTSRKVIFEAVALYFLGVLPSTFPNWGVMLDRAYSGGALFVPDLAYWLFIPLVTIVLLSLGFILFAQGTDRIFNPRVRARHVNDGGGDDPGDDGHTVDETSKAQL
jgi:peptide/nickel transport system permease protein